MPLAYCLETSTHIFHFFSCLYIFITFPKRDSRTYLFCHCPFSCFFSRTAGRRGDIFLSGTEKFNKTSVGSWRREDFFAGRLGGIEAGSVLGLGEATFPPKKLDVI